MITIVVSASGKMRCTTDSVSCATYGKSGGFFRNKYITIISGFIGGGITVFGIAFAFVPSSNISAIFTYEIKLIFGCIGFLIPALIFYRINLRKLKVGEVVNYCFEIELSHNLYLNLYLPPT